MNVAMYLRKSRADENNPLETLERHKEILLSYAKDNNLTVIDIFEEVISGGMLYNRTEMLKLLDAIPSHIYDAVLCIDLDRLGRGSAADSEKIFDVLKENDVKIITLKKIYDLNNEYDEDYSEFEMFMARKELKFITRRMNRGRIKSINDGCFVSGAPFGYRNAVINKKHTLEVYEPEAKYVRMIFDMYVNQSMGITSISRQLANLGVLSKKNTPLHPTTIARMLRNHTYIGKIVWNKSKSVKGKNTQEKTSKDDWLYVPGLHEPIIDENTFNKAQDIINLNTSNETVEKYRLCCRTLGCNKASALSIVEDKVFEVLTKEFKDIELSLKNIRQSHNKDKLSCLDTIATLETELKKLDKQQLRLYDLLEQEVYTKELFLERNNAISDRRKKINATIAQEREKFKLVDTSSIEERLPLLRELLTNYNSLSATEKNSILKNFVKKIEYKREKSAPEGDIFLKIYYK